MTHSCLEAEFDSDIDEEISGLTWHTEYVFPPSGRLWKGVGLYISVSWRGIMETMNWTALRMMTASESSPS